MKTLYIVIPCYNEQEVITETTNKLKEKLNSLINNKKISKKSKILYIDDGSKDNTWKIIKKLNKEDNMITGIRFLRNEGQQNALLAGLLTSKKYADIVISMDCDLQDDINAIDEMIDKYNYGFDIVYAVRKDRKTDSLFKRKTAEIFYKFMNIMGCNIIYNHAEYRLTSKKVLDELENYNEQNIFLRGIFPQLGYKSVIIYYDRNKRFAGKSKYSLRKMIKFALDGIISLSNKPLIIMFIMSIILFLITIILLIFNLTKILYKVILLFMFILIMMFIFILINYLKRIYDESTRKNRYIIKEDLTKTYK